MAGTMTLYDSGGAPLETPHPANAPEDGKAALLSRMDREGAALKARYPDALRVGVSDRPPTRARSRANTAGSSSRTSGTPPDTSPPPVRPWPPAPPRVAESRPPNGSARLPHRLKTEEGGAAKLPAGMEPQPDNGPVLTSAERVELSRAAGCFANNLDRMDHAAAVREHLPIGSGITGAACKTILKARLRGGGMRWHLDSMRQVPCLRALRRGSNRWEQFWKRIDRHGFRGKGILTALSSDSRPCFPSNTNAVKDSAVV